MCPYIDVAIDKFHNRTLFEQYYVNPRGSNEGANRVASRSINQSIDYKFPLHSPTYNRVILTFCDRKRVWKIDRFIFLHSCCASIESLRSAISFSTYMCKLIQCLNSILIGINKLFESYRTLFPTIESEIIVGYWRKCGGANNIPC